MAFKPVHGSHVITIAAVVVAGNDGSGRHRHRGHLIAGVVPVGVISGRLTTLVEALTRHCIDSIGGNVDGHCGGGVIVNA